ncbi:hypothetical protein, partial [Enterococcus faecalis]
MEQVGSSAVEELWPIFFPGCPGIAVRQVFIGCVGLKHKQLAEKCLLVMYTYWERQPWENNNYEWVYTLKERSQKKQ